MATNKSGIPNNIKVMVKVRPLIGREIESNENICWEKISDNEIVELDATTPSKPCIYDHVFGGMDTTQSLYEMAISQIVDSCVQGFNGSVMAYGQTASGKTYTMMGNETNKGIIRLVAENIFDIVEKHDDRDIYMVRCSFLEIYNEKINDLLAPEKTNLEVFETQDGAVMIKDATEKVVRKATNVLDLIEQGNAAKRMGETAMNDRSSRSHTIFRIMIESQEQHEEGSSIKMGILDLVDLAGSESVNKTNATGDRLKEGISINKSLLELGRVIKELSEKKEGEDKFIVFRNSKLTRVIQHSLGGNAKSVVICTVSPAEREETRNTLRFASRAKNVKNTPKLNEILSDQAMIKRLNQKITGLRKQIAEMARQSAGVGHTAESMRQDIIDRIERCEMQFIRSKKASRKQNLRRQTWHCLGNENQDNHQDSQEFEQDSLRALMPPPPPIFTTQRGTHATHHHETFEMPNLMDEEFEPGENMSFTQSPSPKRVCNRIKTPVIFRRRLSAIIEGVVSPDVGRILTSCEKCKVLEEELKELSDYTKLEQMYHVHEENERHSCEDVIENLRADLEEAKRILDSNTDEIESLKVTLEQSKDAVNTANREKTEAIKEKEVAESQLGGVECELEALKSKFEKREKELLGLLSERPRSVDLSREQLIKEKDVEISHKLEEIQMLQKELESTKNDMKELKSKHKTLQTEYDETSMQLVEALQDNDALKAEHEKADSEENELKSKLNESKAKNDELQEQLERETKQIEIFKQELDELRGTVEKLVPMVAAKEELDTLYHDLLKKSEEMTESLETKDRQIEALEQSLSETRANLATKLSEMEENDISEMKIKIDELEKENLDAKKELSEKESENEGLLKRISKLQEEIQAAESEKERLSTELKSIGDVKKEMEGMQVRFDEVTEELKKANSNLGETETQVKELLEKLSIVETEKEDLIKNFEELKEEKEMLMQEIQKMKENTEQSDREIVLQEKIDELEAKIKDYEQKSIEAEQNIQEFEAQIREFEENSKEAAQKIEDLKIFEQKSIEASQKIEEFELIIKNFKELSLKTSENVQKLKEFEAERTQAAQKIEDLELKIKDFEEKSLENSENVEKLKEFEQKIEERKVQLKEFVQKSSESANNIEELEALVEKLTTEKETLENEKQQLSSQISSSNDCSSNQISDLQEKIRDLEKQSSEATQQLNDQISALTTEKSELLKSLEALKSEMISNDDESSSLISELTQEIRNLEVKCQELAEKSTEIQDLRDLLKEVTSEKDKLEQKLSSEKDLLTQEVENLKSQAAENDKSHLISDLNSKIKDLEAKCQSMHAKSLESASLAQTLNEVEDQMRELTSEKDTLERQNEEMRQEITSVKEEKELLGQELEKLQSEMSENGCETSNIITELKENIQELENKCRVLEEKSANQEKLSEETICELKNQISALETCLEEKSSEVTSLEKNLEEMKTRVEQFSTEKELLLDEKEQLLGQISSLKNEMSLSGTKSASLITDLKEKIQILEGKCQDLNEKDSNSAFMSQKLQETEEKLQELTEKLSEIENEKQGIQNKLTKQTEKVDSLQLELLESIDKLREEESNVLKLKSQLEELQNQRSIDTSSNQKTIFESQNTIETLKTEIVQLKSFHGQASNDLTSENAKFKTENAELTMKLATVEERLAITSQQLTLMEAQYQHSSSEFTKLQSKMQQAVQEFNKMQETLVLKEQQLHEVTSRLKQLEAAHEQHTKDMFELDDLRKRTAKDRRSRRQSAHDELRPLVRSIKAIACQTEPTDESCQCRALNEKLEKLKLDLIKAKVTVDHYRLGNDQKVGDIREEKEKVEAKLKEALNEISRLHQEGSRIRKERETLRERLMQMNEEFRRFQDKSRSEMKCKDTQTEMQMPFACNMNSDAVSLEQKLYVKKLEDDLSQNNKKYQEAKKIAQERRDRIKELENALRTRSPEGGKENTSNNQQVSQLMTENFQLKKENGELLQQYQHYKSLYQTRAAVHLKNPEDASQSTVFEKKYRKACEFLNIAKKSAEDYKKKCISIAAERHALGTALSRYDKCFTMPQLSDLDPMYQKGYEEWKRENPDFVHKFKLEQ